jgi:hypothetical protein
MILRGDSRFGLYRRAKSLTTTEACWRSCFLGPTSVRGARRLAVGALGVLGGFTWGKGYDKLTDEDSRRLCPVRPAE